MLAQIAADGSVLELITLNQQRLIRTPSIIDAILLNPARSAEAERRAKETRQEFFEKERGARQIAQELRARGNGAAAEFFESAELGTITSEMSIDDVIRDRGSAHRQMGFRQRRGFADEIVKFAGYAGELMWNSVWNNDHFAFGDLMFFATFDPSAADFIGCDFLRVDSFSTCD